MSDKTSEELEADKDNAANLNEGLWLRFERIVIYKELACNEKTDCIG